MSEPVSNAEIEDVLSSIRRLVSENKTLKGGPDASVDDKSKLVLTPAFRVSDSQAEVPESPASDTIDTVELAGVEPEIMADDDVQSEEGHTADVTDSVTFTTRRSLEDRIAELEEAVGRSAEQWEPDGSEFDTETPDAMAFEPQDVLPAWDGESWEDDPETGNGAESEDAGDDELSMAEDENASAPVQMFTSQPDVPDQAGNDVPQDEGRSAFEINTQPEAETEAEAEPEPESGDEEEFAYETAPEIGAWQADMPEPQPDFGAELMQSGPEDEIGADHMNPEEEAVLPHDQPAFSDDDSTVQDDDVAFVHSSAPEWSPEAEAEPEAEPGEPEAETGIEVQDDDMEVEAFLDEEALRELVSQLVREELLGAVGERVTRNVRRMVRREIQRAMSLKDFE